MFRDQFISAALVAGSLVAAAPTTAKPHKRSSNYAGIVNYGTDIVEASGEITIPTCSVGIPKNSYSSYTSDGWVGISAYNTNYTNSALLQTGVTCGVNRDVDEQGNLVTSISYSVWTEWAPEPPTFFNSTNFRPGDVIEARVISHSPTSGNTYLKNKRTGEHFNWEYKDMSTVLDYTNAEWITESQTFVEDGQAGGQLDATYTPWRYANAKYATKDGKSYLASVDTQIDTWLNGTKIAEGVYLSPGRLEVRDTTPANFTLAGV